MAKDVDITQVAETITMQIMEDEENFICKRIMPYCEAITEKKLSKEELRKMLIAGNKSLEQEPCEDAISRQAVLDINENHHGQMPNHINHQIWKEIKDLPSVTPQYTDAEIQKMQELEQAEIEKAYELGKAEQPKTGRWIDNHNNTISCDRCHTWFNKDDRYGYMHYCPNCGVKMQEVEE